MTAGRVAFFVMWLLGYVLVSRHIDKVRASLKDQDRNTGR